MLAPHKTSAPRRTGVAVLCIVLFGGLFFWKGLHAFRAQAPASSEEEIQVQEGEREEYVGETEEVVLKNNDDVQVGTVRKTVQEEGVMFDVLVTLPLPEENGMAYHVWLVRKGFADVVHMGELFLRADGLWGGTFLANPASGVEDATSMTRLMITRDAQGSEKHTSGIIAAQGTW